MLKITRNYNLSGTIEIEGVAVVQLTASATIDKESPESYSPSGVSRTILNTTLYKQNMSEIRQLISEFEDEIYLMEDELFLTFCSQEDDN